jgi:hypothetical protein
VFADDCSTEQATLAIGFLQDVNASPIVRQMVEAERGVYCLDKVLATEYKVLLELIQHTLDKHQKPLREKRFYESLARGADKIFSEEQIHLLHRILIISPSVLRLHGRLDRAFEMERISEA